MVVLRKYIHCYYNTDFPFVHDGRANIMNPSIIIFRCSRLGCRGFQTGSLAVHMAFGRLHGPWVQELKPSSFSGMFRPAAKVLAGPWGDSLGAFRRYQLYWTSCSVCNPSTVWCWQSLKLEGIITPTSIDKYSLPFFLSSWFTLELLTSTEACCGRDKRRPLLIDGVY